MEEEELPTTATEIPSVSEADTLDHSDTEKPQFIVLKPLDYDVNELSSNKSDLFDKMDIDNHNVSINETDTEIEAPLVDESTSTHVEEIPVTPTSVKKKKKDSGDIPKSAIKVNGVSNHPNADKKTPDSSPTNTPGKSRYGRIRKPKLSTDFVSVDRKSFAVLNNTSSYEHVYADETPHKIPGKRKNKRSYHRRSNVLLIRDDQSSEANQATTKEPTEKVSYITQSIAKDDEAKDPTTSISAEKTAETDVKEETSCDAAISPLNCKDTIKTYSRKGEASSSSAGSEDKQPTNDDETQENVSQINYHELNWKVGDVAWAKIGCYPYWPSIVTLEYGSSIYVKPVGNRRLAVHVQFFGDRGRRSWVLTTSLIKYQSKEQFLELKQQYKKDKIRFKYYLIKQSFQDLWEKAITEADTVLKLPHEERIPYYQSLYPVSEESVVAEMNTSKVKQTPVRRRKNPEERRGRKRKMLIDETLNSSLPPAKKKPRPTSTETSASENTEKLPTADETPTKKIRQPTDEHTKKRRAFMRRMNKILRQSNNNDLPFKKRLQNGLKTKRAENAKFNRLLGKGDGKKPNVSQAAGGSSASGEHKKKDISVYDFESDEETDIFIGTYTSRFTPQILAKIEQEKADKSANDENAQQQSVEGEPSDKPKLDADSNAERKLSVKGKPKAEPADRVIPKGATSKFSKLFEHRKGNRGKAKNNARASRSEMARAKQTKNAMAKKLRDRMQAKTDKETVARRRVSEKMPKKGDYEVFKEKSIETVTAEHPQFTDEEVEKHLEKMWNELDDKEKSKYAKIPSKLEETESTSEDGDDDLKSSGNENDDDKGRSSSPSNLPTSRPKKLLNMFAGYKNEKVCQICEKPGDTVRCRGPCAGQYHVECVQKAAAKNSPEAKKTPGRRGRPRKSSVLPGPPETDHTPSKDEPKKENDQVMEVDQATSEQSTHSSVAEDTKEASGTEDVADKPKSKDDKIVTAKKIVKPVLRRSRRVQEESEKLKNEKSRDNIKDCKTDDDNETQQEPDQVDQTEVDVVEPESKTDKEPDQADQMEVDVQPECKTEKEPEPENEDGTELKDVQPEDVVKNDNTDLIENESPPAEKIDENPKIDDQNAPEEVAEEIKSEPVANDEINAIQKAEEDDSKLAESDKSDGKDSCSEDSGKSENALILDNDDAAASDVSENLSSSTKTDGSNGIDFKCNLCTEGVMYPCFTCGKEKQEKTGDTERYTCCIATCGRVFHKECLKSWPQATWVVQSAKGKGNGSNVVTPKETLTCPQHYCHTCISDNPAVLRNRHNRDKLVRCIRCPTAYHQSMHCIPAGSELLTMTQIICPRHYEPPKMKSTHVNTSWCFICCIGGSLICCEECPTSFHAECLKLSPEEYAGRYICDDCQTGRYLLYGEVAWVKLGHYRWWPARILLPQEVPENIANLPHRRGEFVVRFFGSHDYNWVNRGRAFLYQEGDSGRKNCSRSNVDLTFEKALVEAEEAHQKSKSDKALREEEAKVGLKPPRYVRIKANRPVGNVRIVELNTSNIPDCKCDPTSERPCAPESDCLNRMLLVECNPRVCTAGERCLNRAFEKRQYPPLVPYRTDKRGWGLKTLVDIKKGDFIIEYVGEMIDEEEYRRRVNHMYKNREDNYYFLTIDKDRMLDAGPKGNVSRFMNHSCDPNCETQKWTVNGDTRVGLFAVKDIPADHELVFNYNLATLGNEMKPCLCGSEKCSGFIGVKATKNGNNGNGNGGSEEERKKSTEENRKRSLDDAKASTSSTQKGKKRAKTLAARKLKNKSKKLLSAKNKKKPPEQKTEAEKSPESEGKAETSAKNEETSQTPDSAAGTEADEKPKVVAAKKPKTSRNQKEKIAVSKQEKEENMPVTEKDQETKPDEQSASNDETPPKPETSEGGETVAPEDPKPEEKELSKSSKNRRKISPGSRTKALFEKKRRKGARPLKNIKAKGKGKKKTALMKQKEKLLQKRGKKTVPLKKRKIVKMAIAKKKTEKAPLKKRGRKPHLTEEDREKALFKSLKKRVQRKLRAMVGISKLDERCYVCREEGELIFCDNTKCPRGYHITCVKKFKFPKGRWLCPWHYCIVCSCKSKVAKCSKCVNSFCPLHVEENIFVTSDDAYICKDHKSEYLDARLLSTSMQERANVSTDDDSLLNATASTIEQIDGDTILFPLKSGKTKPIKRKTSLPKLQKKQSCAIKIKQESLSDVEIEPIQGPSKKSVFIGESRNVARRSKKLDVSKKLPENTSPIVNMDIDEYIEVHHVDSVEVPGSVSKTAEGNDAGSEYGECSQNQTDFTVTKSAEVSDDEYVDVEMEEINDDSS